MILIRMFGILDFLAGIVLFLLKFHVGLTLGTVLGIYLILKGVIFFSKIGMLDVVIGVLMLFAVGGRYMPFNWLLSLWLFQKAFFSFFSS